MGPKIFEQTLADPESLAELEYDADAALYEGYQYVPGQVARDLNNGQNFPRSHPHPKEPSGKSWDESKVAELYPKLAAKYDYHD